MHNNLWLIVFLLCGPVIFVSYADAGVPQNSAAEPMVYRYWDWGMSERRDNYQYQLLQAALVTTVEQYGSYKLERVKVSFSTSRARREIGRGNIINVHVGPWRPMDEKLPLGSEPSIRIDEPIFNNLFSYRRLIVRVDSAAQFIAINEEQQLKNLVAGQGKGWVDVKIYKANGYSVNDDANASNLFAMLKGQRFDYVPVSQVEVENILNQYGDHLEVAPQPIVFFPMPMVYYVSAKKPILAERLRLGLARVKMSGHLDSLLNHYFFDELSVIKKLEKKRLYYLTNPFYETPQGGMPPRK